MVFKGRSLKRKVKKATTSITKCRFKVDTAEFLSGLSRVSSMLVLDKIKPEDQHVVICAKGNTLKIECGSSGSYCCVTIPASVAQEGYFCTSITVPQLRYGGDSIIFTTDPGNKKILYSSKIRGSFVSTATPDATIRNRPKKESRPKMVQVPRGTFSSVYYASYFNADVLEDNPDVLVRFDVDKLAKPFKAGKSVMTHSVKITVHDMHRAAFSVDYCSGIRGSASGMFQASTMWRFLKSCSKEETHIKIGSNKHAIWIETDTCTSVSPTIHGKVKDVEEWSKSFYKDESHFTFTVDTNVFLQAIREVSSIHDKNPDSERRLSITSKKRKLELFMESSIGTASQGVAVMVNSSGNVDVDSEFIINSLSLFKTDNAPAFFTVWDSAIRMEVAGDIKSIHFFSTMAQN